MTMFSGLIASVAARAAPPGEAGLAWGEVKVARDFEMAEPKTLHPPQDFPELEAPDAVAERTIEASRSRNGLLSPATARPATLEFDSHRLEQASREVPGADSQVASSPGPPLVQIQSLEVLVRDQPGNVDLYLALARLYLARGRDYEAERLLMRGREATDRDPRIEEFAEEVAMLRLEKKVAAAQKEVDADDTPATRDALQSLVRERDRVEIEIFLQRCRRNPEDLALRYELGCRFKRAGKLAQACERFEESLHDRRIRHATALALGDCCEQMQRIPDALRYYRLAADGQAARLSLECQTDALLRASRLAQNLKLGRLARRYAVWLLQLDPQHQGGAALIERLDRETA